MKTFTLSAGSAPAANVLPSVVGSAVLDAGSGRELDQIQKVPIGERQTLDLLPGDVGCDFRRACLYSGCGHHGHRFDWIAEAASFKSNGYTSPINTRTWIFWGAIPICRAVTSYSARREAEHCVEPAGLRGDFALCPIQGAHRHDSGALERRAARVGHVAPDAPGARLRRSVAHE